MKKYLIPAVSAGCLLVSGTVLAEVRYDGFASIYAGTTMDDDERLYGVDDRVDFITIEGARFNYNHSVGMWDLSWQAVYGNLQKDLNLGGMSVPSEGEKVTGVGIDASRDWFSFRLGYTMAEGAFHAELVPLSPLFSDSNAFNPLQLNEDDSFFMSAGVFIDYQDWLVNAEVVQFEAENSLSPKTDTYYLMFGKRIGEFTLLYTYSEHEEAYEFYAINTSPELIANPSAGMRSVCGSGSHELIRHCVSNQEGENSIHSLTVRWNFHAAAALKIDYTNRGRDGVNGLGSDDSGKLFTVGVDLVF